MADTASTDQEEPAPVQASEDSPDPSPVEAVSVAASKTKRRDPSKGRHVDVAELKQDPTLVRAVALDAPARSVDLEASRPAGILSGAAIEILIDRAHGFEEALIQADALFMPLDLKLMSGESLGLGDLRALRAAILALKPRVG